jgi:predicted nucleotidyltransferase
MTTAVAPNIPPAASPDHDAFRDALVKADAANVVCIAVYGSAARGRYDPDTSDLNVAVALRDAGGAAVLRIAQAVHDAERESRIETMIFAEKELAGLAASFPTKILDIQRRHVVLHGTDLFVGITVERDDIRRRAEQELRNLALRLRRRLVAARADDHALALAADDAAATLAVNLRALLYLRGEVSDEFQPTLAIFERAGALFGLDASVLQTIKRVHKNDEHSMSADQFGRVIDVVSSAAEVAASLR